mgnify:CR=1 FL=1
MSQWYKTVGTESDIAISTRIRLARNLKNLPFPARRAEGTGIFLTPERYCPVRDRGSAMTSSGVPAATISPQRAGSRIRLLPAPLFTILGAGQPILMSIKSGLWRMHKAAPSAMVAGSEPKTWMP